MRQLQLETVADWCSDDTSAGWCGDEIAVDLFSGGGGASFGIEMATGRPIAVAINHDPEAVAMHQANHPHTRHFCRSVFDVHPTEATGGRRVRLLWASPACTHHSRARGGRPVTPQQRDMAWVVIDWMLAVRPQVVFCENVLEWKDWGGLIPKRDSDGNPMLDARTGEPILVPDPQDKGRIFREFVGQMRNLGYQVEWQMLNAADYGAPTSRKRLFLVARCDGAPICWPEPTHGPGRPLPYRTAAECIDWSIPCPSIFLTPEEAKAWGKAHGVPAPKRPLEEATLYRLAEGTRRFVLDDPEPFLVQVNHGRDVWRGQGLEQPLPTITGRHGYGLVIPKFIARYTEARPGNHRGFRADVPLHTITAREGGGFQLCLAHLAKHNGKTIGQSLHDPMHTLVSTNNKSLVAACVTKYHGGAARPARVHDLREPIRTLDTQNRFGLVAAFLTRFNRCGVGQRVDEPLMTVVSKDRFAVVTVEINGDTYALCDITMRMLTPRELARAQGFPDEYVLVGTKADQVARIGNSVCPAVAQALVQANLAAELELVAVGGAA